MQFLARSLEPFRLVIACALALTFVSTSAMASALTEGNEYEPPTFAFRIGKIKELTVELKQSAEEKRAIEAEGCGPFNLTRNDALNYFRTTGSITQRDYIHTLTYTNCTVSGKLTLQDGRTGEWLIKKVGGGRLTLSDGTEFYLYCAKCRSKKFVR